MTQRALALIRHDVRMQFRYGIYIAYAFVVIFYVAALYWGGAYLPNWVPALIIFTDPAVVGFFFLGALMMLEKGEGVRSALATSPVRAMDYFWSKAITLTTIAVISVSIITPFVHAGANWPLLVIVVALTSMQSIGIGTPAALYFKSVTSYLIGAAGWLTPLVLPGFLAFLNPMPDWVILIPPAAQLRLLMVATHAAEASALQIAIMLGVISAYATICVLWARRSLLREFGR